VLGEAFEREIREQPAVWNRIAQSDKAERLARAVGDRPVLLVGSGSSLFMGQLGALALRRRGLRAVALAATEAHFDHNAYRDASVIAISQSGRSTDLLAALDILKPASLIALTNSENSPLAERANEVIALEAGLETAVPATKSVTGTAAILLWAAALVAGTSSRDAGSLTQTAADVGAWLDGPALAQVSEPAHVLARQRSVVIAGAGYGVPIANEIALKCKEAAYVHAEGFAAGEFRHGSSAILDERCAIVGIVDDASRPFVARPLEEARAAGAARFAIGAPIGDVVLLGAQTAEAFNTLAWLVAGQVLALALGRARGIDGDSPRGLSKVLV
jgi:glutamine---fructose-6-phosphate transaminase (isomerizing)